MSNQNTVNIGDTVEITEYQGAALEGEKVVVTREPDEYGAITYDWTTPGGERQTSWVADEWSYKLIEHDDPVNHPSHYTQYPVEVIELTEHMPFLEGNVVKYVARAPYKGNKVQDLEKAKWYLDRAIKKAKGENGD